MTEKIELGDIVRLKKKHPCGGYEWEVIRLGTDFRLQCTTCQRQVWLERREVIRRTKKIIKKQLDENSNQ